MAVISLVYTESTKTLIHRNQCMHCDEVNELTVNAQDFKSWQNGMHIQIAFSYLNVDERELILTGTHAECWNAMFKEEES